MKVFITGHKGYVGRELIKRGFLPLDCDITNWSAVEREVQTKRPALLIHLAGKSNVNWCEQKENAETVILSNLMGTKNVFENLQKQRIPGAFLSTDQIWRGGVFEAHRENSKKTPPVNFYALSKLAAESAAEAHCGKVIRTSYLFNAERLKDHLRDMAVGAPVSYPVFIRRSFMHLSDFCDALEMYCANFYQMPKVLHLSGSDTVSWFTFMREVARQYGYNKNTVLPRFREVLSPAPRPWFGGLNTQLAQSLFFKPRSYRDGIKRMITAAGLRG